MKEFRSLISEVKRNLQYIILLESVLSSFLTFAACFIIFLFAGVSSVVALILSVVAFLLFLYRYTRRYTVQHVEEAYPLLQERLRTAIDNAAVSNEVVEDLQSKVLQDARHLSPGMFFDSGRFTLKLLLSLLLTFLVIFTSFYQLEINTFRSSTVEAVKEQAQQFGFPVGGNISDEFEAATGAGASPNKNIFGNPSIAQVGDKTVDVTIRPSKYEFTVRDVTETNTKEFKSQFPNEIAVEQSGFYQETIPKDDQEIVKTYFKKLTEQ